MTFNVMGGFNGYSRDGAPPSLRTRSNGGFNSLNCYVKQSGSYGGYHGGLINSSKDKLKYLNVGDYIKDEITISSSCYLYCLRIGGFGFDYNKYHHLKVLVHLNVYGLNYGHLNIFHLMVYIYMIFIHQPN